MVAFLSKPAANPTGFLNVSPKIFRSNFGLLTTKKFENSSLAKGILSVNFNAFMVK
jgi:hypothetical protein